MNQKNKPSATPRDGNAFSILGATRKALRKSGMSHEHVDKIMQEAKSGDYDHLLATCMKHVDLECD